MRRFGWIIAIFIAILLHAGFILFGGLIFGTDNTEKKSATQEVELVTDANTPEKEKDKPKDQTEKKEEVESETERPPDAEEMIKNLETPAVNDAPALEAASLSAIEQALNGQAGTGGEFSEGFSFASGGRIGGMGKAGGLSEKLENAFSLTEIDQKPKAINQPAPPYPAEMRGKKVEGVVSVIFVVDASGKVTNPKVEKSSHAAFDKPALDAVRQWKFEPAIKGGQRVGCRMRVPIRFQQS